MKAFSAHRICYLPFCHALSVISLAGRAQLACLESFRRGVLSILHRVVHLGRADHRSLHTVSESSTSYSLLFFDYELEEWFPV
jgi:hypothetical protein